MTPVCFTPASGRMPNPCQCDQCQRKAADTVPLPVHPGDCRQRRPDCRTGDKAAAPIVGRSDLGGVRLDLTSAADVATAYREIESALGDDMPGVVVQAMAAPGIETVVEVEAA